MRKKVFAVLAAAAFLTPAVLAQHAPPTPATLVQHLVDRLTKEGIIDTSQQASASACFLPAVTSNASVEAMLRADHKQLETDLAGDNLGGIETDINAISMLESEIPGNNATALVCLVKLLNPTEAAKLAQGRGMWGFGLTPGPGGPRGGPGGFGGRGPQ
jgi:hypothetical protein